MFKINKYFLLYVLVSVYKKIYIIQIISQSIRHAIHRYCFQTVIARHLNTFSPGAPGVPVLEFCERSLAVVHDAVWERRMRRAQPHGQSRAVHSTVQETGGATEQTARYDSLGACKNHTQLFTESVNYSRLWCMFTME